MENLLGDLGGVATAVASGGVTGIIGGVLSLVGHYFGNKQKASYEADKAAHEERMRKFDIEEAKIEGEQAGKIAELNAETQEQTAGYKALTESYKAQQAVFAGTENLQGWQQGLMTIARFTTAMTRPVITFSLIFASMWLFGPTIVADAQAGQLGAMAAFSILYMTTTAVIWWFADRAGNKAMGVPKMAGKER